MSVESADEKVQAVAVALEQESRINMQNHPVRVFVEEDHLVMEGAVADIAARKLAVSESTNRLSTR